MSVDAAFGVTLGGFTLAADLHVGDGEVLAVLGPNGAGKSTLLRALAGLIPIDTGRISLGGTVVDDPAERVFVPPEHRSVGVVFQNYLLFEHLDALDNVAFGLREHGARRGPARARAATLLAEVGMDDRSSARPHELSGGQAQRVALARALATEPRLLLLDEPLAALDVQTRAETRRHLRRVLERFTGARILVTHDPVDALALADRILVLERGEVVQTGTPDEITRHPRSEYVAELVGVNLYRGRADGDHIRVGTTVVTAAGPASGEVIVIVAPNAVVVSRARPARERPQRLARHRRRNRAVRARGRVRLRVVGELTIVAEVTPAAVDELGIVEGSEVWAAVKATEIEVFPT